MKKFTALFALVVCWSCNNDQLNKKNADVYIVGYGPRNPHTIVQYWKNGNPVALTDGTNGALGNGIFVNGNDVYIAGSEAEQNGYKAKYWKNGKAVTLPDSSAESFANCIAVSGSDVYVGGYIQGQHTSNRIAAYWKNSVLIPLSDGSEDGIVNSICISGSNVYLAGTYNCNATYWLNGVANKLPNGCHYANAIAILNKNVYVAGYKFIANPLCFSCPTASATYWKNGVEVALTQGPISSQATSIAVEGNDVYAAGYDYQGVYVSTGGGTSGGNNIALYWKNGTPVNLSDGSRSASATSIAIDGSDVHVIGAEGGIAKYWKNGKSISLNSTDSSKVTLSSIFLSR